MARLNINKYLQDIEDKKKLDNFISGDVNSYKSKQQGNNAFDTDLFVNNNDQNATSPINLAQNIEPDQPEVNSNPFARISDEYFAEKKSALESNKERQARLLKQNALGGVLSGLGTILIGKPQTASDKQSGDQQRIKAFDNYQNTLAQLNNLPSEEAKLNLENELLNYNQGLKSKSLNEEYDKRKELAKFNEDLRRETKGIGHDFTINEIRERAKQQGEVAVLKNSLKDNIEKSILKDLTANQRNQRDYYKIRDNGRDKSMSVAVFQDVLNRAVDDMENDNIDYDGLLSNYKKGTQNSREDLNRLVNKYFYNYYNFKNGIPIEKRQQNIDNNTQGNPQQNNAPKNKYAF